MADTGSWIVVDDRDPAIAYSGPPGAMIWHGGVSQEYDQTTTGLESGDMLTYYFNASRIGVFGTYGPTGPTGPPIAFYHVDDSATTTVTGPVTQATLYRQTFWTSDPLSLLAPGAFHKLVLTASVPNATLWIDYLAYPTATSATNTASTSSATGTGISSTSSTNATPTSHITTTPTTTATGSPTTPNTTINTPAIVIGAVVGVIVLIIAAAAFAYKRGRRSRPTATERLTQGPNEAAPNMAQALAVAPNLPPSGDVRLSIAQQPSPRDPPSRPLPPLPVKSIDGGVRLMGGSMEMPPEYQEHY